MIKICLILIPLVGICTSFKSVKSEFLVTNTNSISDFSSVAQNVSGTYNTDFGQLVLKQSKNTVTGTYSYENFTGTISGTITKNKLTFTWKQKQWDVSVKGTGEFDFSEDGKSFTGTWTDSNGNSGYWNGNKN